MEFTFDAKKYFSSHVAVPGKMVLCCGFEIVINEKIEMGLDEIKRYMIIQFHYLFTLTHKHFLKKSFSDKFHLLHFPSNHFELSFLSAFMKCNDIDKSLVAEGWIENHFKWVVRGNPRTGLDFRKIYCKRKSIV